MNTELPVNPVALREEVKSKYRDVARNPNGEHHFHTGRPLARRLGYDSALVNSMPDVAVESFAGVANPFALRALDPGEKVVDAGSNAGLTASSLPIRWARTAKSSASTCSRKCWKSPAQRPSSWGSSRSSFARDFWNRYR